MSKDTRFSDEHSIGHNPQTKRLELEKSQQHGRKLRNKCYLFDVCWGIASSEEYKTGKKVRLMVIYSKVFL